MGEDPIVAVIPTIFAVTGDRVKGRPLKAFAWSDARASQRCFIDETLLAHQKVIFNFQTTSEVYYDMLDMSRAIFIGIVELLCYERCSLTAVCFYHLRLNPRQTSKLLRLTQLANLLRYRPVR